MLFIHRATATVLVQRGVLKKGSVVVAGSCSGKVISNLMLFILVLGSTCALKMSCSNTHRLEVKTNFL